MQEDNLSDITLTPRIPTVEDNPFIATAQKMAQPDQLGLNAPEDNPFLAIAKGMGGTSQPPAIGSITSTLSINPDQAAQASKLGGQFGLGQDIALRNMDELRRRSLITRLQQTGMLEKNPALAESLANPAFSAQAHDDIDNLAETGSWIDSIAKGWEGGWRTGEEGTLRYSPLSGAVYYGSDPLRDARIAFVRERQRETAGSGVLYMTSQVASQMAYQAPEIATFGLGGAAIGGSFGGPAGAAVGFGAGLKAGMVASTAKMEAGVAYGNLVEQGVDPDEAAYWAAGIGGINGMIELAGTKVLQKTLSPFINWAMSKAIRQVATQALVQPTVAGALTTAGKLYSLEMMMNGVEEASQDTVGIIGEELAKLSDGIESEVTLSDAASRIADAFVAGVQGSVLLGAIGPGARLAYDTRRARQTQAQQQWLDGLQERVAESKVRERNPNAFQEFVEKQVEGKPVATIYVDAEEAKGVLAQLNLTVSQVDAIVPGFAEQVRTEAERGGDVTIPTAVFSAKLANTDLGNALRPHMRLSPEALSVTQLEAVRAERERMSAAGQDVIDERLAAEDTAFVESATRVEETMYSELTAAGQPATEAKINAEFVRNMMASLADRVGVTPEQMFERYPYRVRGEGQAEQAQELEQAVQPETLAMLTDEEVEQLADYAYDVGATQEDIDLIETEVDRRFREEDDPAGEPDTTTGIGIEELLRDEAKRARQDGLSNAQLGEYIRNSAEFAIITQAAVQQGITDEQLGSEAYAALDAQEARVQAIKDRMSRRKQQRPLEQAARPTRLMAVHNLSADNLAFAEQMGGLAVPSIGVITEERGGVEGFGEITLIGTQEMADPATSRVFSSDAYSARFPRAEWPKVKRADTKRIIDEIRGIATEFDERYLIDQTYNLLAERPNAHGLVDAWRRSPAVMALFLRSKGIDARPVTYQPESLTGLSWDAIDRLNDLYDAVDWSQDWDSLNADPGYMDLTTAYAREWTSQLGDAVSPESLSRLSEFGPGTESRLRRDLANVKRLQVDREGSRQAFESALQPYAVEFKDWIDKKILDVFGAPFLRVNGKKSPYTLPNIVKYMSSARVINKEKGMTFGPGAARAATAEEFVDLEQMREAANKSIVDPSAFAKATKKTEKLLDEYRSEMIRYTDMPTWDALDASMRAVARYANARSQTDATMRSVLRSEGFEAAIPDSAIALAKKASDALMAAPVPYFEAKPQRAVRIGEFAGAVIPSNATQETRDILDRNGVRYMTYLADNEQDRQRAVREMARSPDAAGQVFFQRPVTPGFYSALEREVSAIDAKALTAAGWGERLKGLVNKGAIKADELEWSGLNDYLQMQEGKVSKNTVIEFLRGNGVKVEVIRLGDRQQAVDQAAIAGSFVAEDDLRKSDEGLSPEVEAAFNTYRTLIETGASRGDIAQQMFIIDDALDNAFGTDLDEYIASEYRARPETRYEEYTLPGGTNYREVLLKLSVSEPQIVVSNNLSVAGEKEVYHLSFSEIGREGPTSFVVEQSDGSWKAEYLDEFTLRDTKESAISWARARMQPSAPRLKALAGVSSTHWQERNVLVHLRMNDRVDSDGKRVLFVEEVQSDWGQEGVKRGFVNQRAADMAELDNLFAQQEANPTDARKKQIARVRDRIYKNEYNVSRAPFVETTDGWLNLGLKQVLLEAVTGNYDRVAFVTGEQSADRYDLSKKVDRIVWNETTGELAAREYADTRVIKHTGVTKTTLQDIIGKEAAERLINAEESDGWRRIEGEDLKVGGEGMQDFYDKIVPAAMNKLLKKYGGGKLGVATINQTPQHSFDITPAMVEKLATGLPLFQAARGQARGGFDPQKLLTTLNKDADFSTFAHETAHYFLTILGDVAARPDAPASVVDDMNTLLRWFGVKDLATWNAMSLDQQRQYHEQFAYSFETYLFEGKAPSVEMQGLFDQFARWLKQVYQGLITKINDVYKAEFGKDLPILTGEVRQVMDRMLATEDQIARAQAIREMKPQFQTQEQSGMDDAAWAAYQELQEQATERAVAELTTATLKEMAWMSRARGRKLRELQRQHDDKRKEIKDEVTEDLRILPVYRAMEFLKRGKVVDVDGTTKPATGQFKLSAAGVQAVMPPGFDVATLGRGRYGMVNEDGLHPDLIAPLYGYASGAELVTALSTAKPFADAVAERTDQRMLSEFSELADPAARSLAVDRAIHNEARARLIAVEQRWAAKLQQPVSVIMEAASQVAGEVIGRQAIRTLSPRAYAAAEARAARLATSAYSEPQSPEQAGQTAATRAYNAAIAAGKTVEEATAESLSAGVAAVETARQRRAEFHAKYGGKSPAEVMMRAKRQQLLQNMLARQALEARAEIDRARSAFKRFFGSDEKIAKTRNMEMVSAARAILGWYGFGKRDKSPAEYVDQLRAYNPAAYAQLEPLILRATKGPQDYRDLTVDEFRVLRDTVDGLWIQARKDKQVKLADRTMALDEVVGELDQRLEEIGVPKVVAGEKRAPTFRDRAARNLMTLRSTMRRVESWADAMDGVSTVRPFTNYLVRPVLDAVDKFTASRNKYMKRFRDLVVNLQMPEGTISAPELDYTFGAGNAGIGKAELLGALLHTGNASNYRKLLLGRGWGQEDEFGNLDDTQFKAFVKRMQDEGVLTKADYDFLQSVWDLNEDIKPIAQKAHYELYGFYFTEIPATEVVTPFGTYRGGYVPAATDKFMVTDAAQRAGEEELESDWRNSLPSTGRGFTQTRMAGYNKALSLDVRVIGAHIDAALRFSMIQPAITQALRILRSREFAARLDRVDPTVKQELLIPWLNRTARQLVSQPGKYKAVDAFWRGVRTRTGMSIMFANLRNAMQQVTGLFPAAVKVQPRYLTAALTEYVGSPQRTANSVAALSPFMEDRLKGQSFEVQEQINEVLLNPSRFDRAQAWTDRHGYFLQQAFQNMVDVVTWVGAYNQSLSTTDTTVTAEEAQREAIAAGDAAVRLTQGSVRPSDVSAFESGTPFFRTLTQFAGYFNMLANLNATEYVKVIRDMGFRGNKGKLVYIYMMGFMLPAVVSDAIVRTLGGGWEDEDEDGYLDVFMDWFFGSQIRQGVAFVPFGTTAYTLATTAFDDKPYNDRMTTSPSVASLEAATVGVGKAAIAVVDEEKDVTGKNVRDVLTLLSLATGIPFSVLGRPAGYLVDVQRGEVEPTSTYDMIRGTITGTATPESKR